MWSQANSSPIKASQTRGRSPLAAGLISLFAPGVGHIYVGRARRGVVLFLIFILVQALQLALAFVWPPTVAGIVAFAIPPLIAAIGVFGFIVIDAARLARKSQRTQGYPWYVYVVAVLAVHAILAPSTKLVPFVRAHASWRIFTAPPTGSMEPTIKVGEAFIVDQRYFATHSPGRGDVVVFKFNQPKQPTSLYVKRVIALAGERVAFRDGVAIVNGRALPEPYARVGDPKAPFNNTPEVKVAAGGVYVVGDNRANSIDSRMPTQVGTVPIGNLLGRATEIFRPSTLDRLGLWIGSANGR